MQTKSQTRRLQKDRRIKKAVKKRKNLNKAIRNKIYKGEKLKEMPSPPSKKNKPKKNANN